jgi:hypothetical protein
MAAEAPAEGRNTFHAKVSTHAQYRPALSRAPHRRPGDRKAWRIIYRVDPDAIVILDSFAKKSQATPKTAIARAARRLRLYDEHANEAQQ